MTPSMRVVRRGPGRVALLVAALLVATVLALAPARPAGALEPAPVFGTNFGVADFGRPNGVAVDIGGGIYLADDAGARKFDTSGTVKNFYGSLGTGNGQNYYTSGVAVDAATNVYVADRLNARINKYASGGGLLTSFGSYGSGPGQFDQPTGIAISSGGNVYVSDGAHGRIEQFTAGGAFVRSWGSPGSGLGQLSFPRGLAVDSSGNVLVADSGNNRIVKYTGSGTLLTTYGSAGSGNGQFSGPTGVAVDTSGNLYVADSGNVRIQKLNGSGVYVTKWGSAGRGSGQFLPVPDTDAITGIAVGGSVVYVTDANNYRMQKFSLTGTPTASWGGPNSTAVAEPTGMVTDGTNVYVADKAFDFVRVYDVFGTPVRTIGAPGSGAGQLNDPTGLALDAGGSNLYVVDRGNNRILRFSTGGAYLSAFGGAGSGPGQFNGPTGIARDPDGNYLVTDTFNNRVQRFTAAGTYLSQWGTPGSAPGQLQGPTQIAVDKAGTVYLDDGFAERIQRFNATGTFVGTVASGGSAPGTVSYVDGLTTDAAGNLWVGERNNHRFEKFSAGGALLAAAGSFGSTNGKFSSPRGVAVTPAGVVFVADAGNSRITRWTTTTPTPSGFVGVTPTRVLDTRNGTGAPVGKVGPGATIDVAIAGAAGSGVPAGATAVVLNLAVTGPTAGTYVTAFPAGSTRPTAANLVAVPGQTVPNLVTVKVGAGGAVSLFNAAGSSHLIADVFGYYKTGTGNGFTPLAPTRILDSRPPANLGFAGPIGPGATKTLTVTGGGSPVPVGAKAVVLNVTATQGTAGTYLTVFPAGGSVPTAANLNVGPNQTISNLVVVPLSADGKASFYNNLGNVHVIGDVVGYYSVASTAKFVPVEPARNLDSRVGLATSPAPWPAGTYRDLQVTGQAGVAPNATAVVMNVTATEATAGSYVTVYPSDASLPTAASLVFGPGQTVPNLVAVKLSPTGSVRIFNQLGTVQVVADVAGYFV